MILRLLSSLNHYCASSPTVISLKLGRCFLNKCGITTVNIRWYKSGVAERGVVSLSFPEAKSALVGGVALPPSD